MKLQQYIEDSLRGEWERIKNSLPEGISDQQKRAASMVLNFVQKQALGILEKSPDFDWGDFDRFCQYMAELIDSRKKIEGSGTTGISYEWVYKKQNIEWLLEMLQKSLEKHEKEILLNELKSLFERNAALGENVSVRDIAQKKPHLYRRLAKLLRISEEGDISEWKRLEHFLPEKLRPFFVLRKLTDEEKELNALGIIEARDLEKIIVDHGRSPRKMAYLLRILHPDLTEEEIRIITRIGFKGLSEKSDSLLDRFWEWPATLSPIEVFFAKNPGETNVYTATGTAPKDCSCIFISSVWSKRVDVEPGKPFSFIIKLNPGENLLTLFSIDESKEERSASIFFRETGEETEDHELSLVLLLWGIEDLEKQMELDATQRNLVMETLELTFIKNFSYSFEEGEKGLLEVISNFQDNPTVTRLLHEVLRKFKRIEQTPFVGLRTDSDASLMFFQKYAAYRINQLREKWLPGAILALEPGLGKTITALVAWNGDEMMIVCPNSVVSGWSEEASKFFHLPSIEPVYDMSIKERSEVIRNSQKQCIVTNLQSIQQIDNEELFGAINKRRLAWRSKTAVFDEAHFLKNQGTKQSKWARQIEADFSLWLTASPFKNVSEFRRMMHALLPDDQRFKSEQAFLQAFPSNDVTSLRLLNQLKRDYVIRFLKEDVMREFDPRIPLAEQSNCLPRKHFFGPEQFGSFTILPEQAEAIELLMTDYALFEKRYAEFFSKKDFAVEDRKRLYTDKNHLAKRHAYRQIINNPKFVGVTETSPKHRAMDAIVEREISQGNKVVIFCMYLNQAEEYRKRYKALNPSMFTGATSDLWMMRRKNGDQILYEVGPHGEWVFDKKTGYPKESKNGRPMSAMDYERLTFQHTHDRQLIITTFSAGAVGTTFTRAWAMVYDDLPEDYVQAYQSEDRIHRIDNLYKKYAVNYYYLAASYPEEFLEESKKKRVVVTDKNGKETTTTRYRKYFAQGTYDQVHFRNLENQRVVFRLINDEVEDESLIEKLNSESTSFFSGSEKNELLAHD